MLRSTPAIPIWATTRTWSTAWPTASTPSTPRASAERNLSPKTLTSSRIRSTTAARVLPRISSRAILSASGGFAAISSAAAKTSFSRSSSSTTS